MSDRTGWRKKPRRDEWKRGLPDGTFLGVDLHHGRYVSYAWTAHAGYVWTGPWTNSLSDAKADADAWAAKGGGGA